MVKTLEISNTFNTQKTPQLRRFLHVYKFGLTDYDFGGLEYKGKNEKVSLLVQKMEILCKEYAEWYKKRKDEIMALIPER